MFSSVVTAGIKILHGVNLSRRNTLILIVSLGLGDGSLLRARNPGEYPLPDSQRLFLWDCHRGHDGSGVEYCDSGKEGVRGYWVLGIGYWVLGIGYRALANAQHLKPDT
jgi:hypothetical protein